MKPYAEAIKVWEVEPEVGNVGRPELIDLAMAYRCLSKALQVSSGGNPTCSNVLRAVSINSDSLIGLATKGAFINSGGSVSREYPLITTNGTPRFCSAFATSTALPSRRRTSSRTPSGGSCPIRRTARSAVSTGADLDTDLTSVAVAQPGHYGATEQIRGETSSRRRGIPGGLASKRAADRRALALVPIIRKLMAPGFVSYRALVDELNRKGIPAARGGR
jgi:hypothetical protein